MRISLEAKEETRGRILAAARKLFRDNGFERTTTRDIAAAAGIATGTLFNYYPTKEMLAATILADALDAATTEFRKRTREGDSLEESLFALVALGLRHLRPHRGFVAGTLESALSPFGAANDAAERIRTSHLELVFELIATRRADAETVPSAVVMHLYWALFLGVLAFWAADSSPKQEETLALLDHSIRLFVASLATQPKAKENDREREPEG